MRKEGRAISALYRLKAYFGMVPPEDMDAYLDYDRDYDGEHGYYDDRREPYPGPPRPRSERVERDADWAADRAFAQRRYPDPPSPERTHLDRRPVDPPPVEPPAPRAAPGGSVSGRGPLTRGSLAVESNTPEPPRPSAPMPDVPRPSAPVERPAGPTEVPLSRITTVHPRSYIEARTIGERYRDGIPVIMNLTELDDAAARRLVDFAAGLAFGLRGSIDKVTNRVFLLSPMGVEVSAEDRRKLAERGFFGQD